MFRRPEVSAAAAATAAAATVTAVISTKSDRGHTRMSEQRLRFGSLNVHCLSNAEKLVDLLRVHEIDVLCLQEAPGDSTINPFAEKLGMKVAVIRYADHGLFNCILVRESGPLWRGMETMVLDLPDLTKRTTENRCAVCLTLPSIDLTVCCTHLDAYSEDTRLSQWAQCADALPKTPTLVMGDFNALQRCDYRDEEWDALVEKRRKAGIESELNLVEKVVDDGYQDMRKGVGFVGKIGPTATSVYGARVDYSFMNEAAMEKFGVCRYEHVDTTLAGRATDHCLIMADVMIKEARSLSLF